MSGTLQLIRIWSVCEEIGDGGFGSKSRHLGYFLSHGEAVRAGCGKGYCGGNSAPTEHGLVTADGKTGYLVDVGAQPITACASVAEAARAAALAKLTPEERAVLGLEEP